MKTERGTRVGWFVMTLLAIVVSGYATMVLWKPDAIAFMANRDGVLRSMLVAHASVGAVALSIGPFQFRQRLRRTWPTWHRRLGRVYLGCVYFGGVTGLWLAFSTPGGLPAQSGFFMMAVLWLVTGSLALRAVRAGKFAEHRAWMLRSYALTFGAVTLRLYLGLGVAVAGLPFDEVYGSGAWASWAVNLLLVEWLFLRDV